MHIRLVEPEDWKKFRDVRLMGMESDPQALGGDITEEKNRDEEGWRNRLGNPNRFFFAVQHEDVFVAIAGAVKKDEKNWLLVGVYTIPSMRGKGLAQALVKRVLEECGSRGVEKIQLMVNIDQKDAVYIYEKIGFAVIDILKNKKMADGKFHDEYLMEMKLADCR